MSTTQAQPPYVTNNNGSPTTTAASEFLQVAGDHLVFEDQQRFPGVFVGNLH